MREFEEYIPKLRELEAAAAADPGREMDHDHDASEAWNSYVEGWSVLEKVMAALPQPTGWLEVDRWCDSNNGNFGEAEPPGTHMTRMNWNPEGRSVRDAVRTTIVNRLRESGDEDVFRDPRLRELILRLAHKRNEWDSLAQALCLLPDSGEVIRELPPSPFQKKAEDAAVRLGQFSVTGWEVFRTPEHLHLHLRFRETLPAGRRIHVVIKPPGVRLPESDSVMLTKTRRGMTADVFQHARARVFAINDGLIARFDEKRMPEFDAFTIGVGGDVPWHYRGLRKAGGLKCLDCGKDAKILVDLSCCGTAKNWKDVACPECRGTVFLRRFHKLDDYVCACLKGWTIREGKLEGADLRNRARDTGVWPDLENWIGDPNLWNDVNLEALLTRLHVHEVNDEWREFLLAYGEILLEPKMLARLKDALAGC